jgi:hypothetical protein
MLNVRGLLPCFLSSYQGNLVIKMDTCVYRCRTVQITRVLVDGLPLQIPLGAVDIWQNDDGGVYLSTTMPIGMVLQRRGLRAPHRGATEFAWGVRCQQPVAVLLRRSEGGDGSSNHCAPVRRQHRHAAAARARKRKDGA